MEEKQKKATKQRKSLHDLCSTSRLNNIKKTLIKLVRPTPLIPVRLSEAPAIMILSQFFRRLFGTRNISPMFASRESKIG